MSSSESFYDALAQSYPTISGTRASYLSSIESIISAHIVNYNNEKLLDLGSGDGLRIQKILRETQVEITAVESSAEMCRLLRNNSSISRVLESDITHFEVEPSIFNYVTALWNVFGHVEDIDTAINKAYESLADGGVFIFDINNPLNIGEYGSYSVIRNFLSFIFHGNEKTFRLITGGTETRVYFRPHWYYRKLLKRIGFRNISFVFVNYKTGKKATLFSGQLLVKCDKLT